MVCSAGWHPGALPCRAEGSRRFLYEAILREVKEPNPSDFEVYQSDCPVRHADTRFSDRQAYKPKYK